MTFGFVLFSLVPLIVEATSNLRRDVPIVLLDAAGHTCPVPIAATSYYVQPVVFSAHFDSSTTVDPFLNCRYLTITHYPTDVFLSTLVTTTILPNGKTLLPSVSGHCSTGATTLSTNGGSESASLGPVQLSGASSVSRGPMSTNVYSDSLRHQQSVYGADSAKHTNYCSRCVVWYPKPLRSKSCITIKSFILWRKYSHWHKKSFPHGCEFFNEHVSEYSQYFRNDHIILTRYYRGFSGVDRN